MNHLRYYISLIVVTNLWFWLDFASKYWAEHTKHLPWGKPEEFFYLSEVTHNTGIAFGFPVPRWAQLMVTVLILIFLLHMGHEWLKKNKKWLLQALIFGLAIGGALGNFWERLIQGYVVDFIVLKPFPNFNLADVGVTLGLLGLIVFSWKIESNGSSENSVE